MGFGWLYVSLSRHAAAASVNQQALYPKGTRSDFSGQRSLASDWSCLRITDQQVRRVILVSQSLSAGFG